MKIRWLSEDGLRAVAQDGDQWVLLAAPKGAKRGCLNLFVVECVTRDAVAVRDWLETGRTNVRRTDIHRIRREIPRGSRSAPQADDPMVGA